MAAVKAQAQAELVAGKAALKAKQYDEAIEKLANALQIMCVAVREPTQSRLLSRAERSDSPMYMRYLCVSTLDTAPGLRPASTRQCSSTWHRSTSSTATPS